MSARRKMNAQPPVSSVSPGASPARLERCAVRRIVERWRKPTHATWPVCFEQSEAALEPSFGKHCRRLDYAPDGATLDANGGTARLRRYARRAHLVMLALFLAGATARAQSDAGVEAPSAADLADIERALGQDAQEAKRTTTAPGVLERVAAPVAAAVQSLNPDLSFILDVALAGFSAEEPLQGGGHDPTKNGFNLQQLELAVGAAVDPYFRFDANIVFGQDGVEIEEAYGTTLSLPAGLQVRAGQFLTRFGRHNPMHLHVWDFVDQPFPLTRVFGGEGNRGLGVELSYLTPLPWYVELVGSATDAAGEGTARSFYGADDLGVRSPFDLQLTAALKQFFPLSDDLSLAWGLSAANGPSSTGYGNRTDLYGTDVYLKYRPLSQGSVAVVAFTGELFYRRRQVPGDVLQDTSAYAQVFWRFAQRWAVAARYELGTPSRGAQDTPDPLDPDWTSSRQRVTASATFWPTEFSRLRLQTAADFAPWRTAPTYSAFLALELAVGAHGAHSF